MSAPNEDAIRAVCHELAEMLVAKNAAYGDSALNPYRVFSKDNRVAQLKVRIDDKLSRIARGSATLVDDDEDVVMDLFGYLALLIIAMRMEKEEDDLHD